MRTFLSCLSIVLHCLALASTHIVPDPRLHPAGWWTGCPLLAWFLGDAIGGLKHASPAGPRQVFRHRGRPSGSGSSRKHGSVGRARKGRARVCCVLRVPPTTDATSSYVQAFLEAIQVSRVVACLAILALLGPALRRRVIGILSAVRQMSPLWRRGGAGGFSSISEPQVPRTGTSPEKPGERRM
ncbi:hypothetical protein VTK73DRAFT_1318 [Phialemonium thermophilum]|uniref:Uncharacterized protein n=1 Tax=Phialemonium thermophilum TaxID=223376 RepID=A0ABR3VTR1_9PEZI